MSGPYPQISQPTNSETPPVPGERVSQVARRVHKLPLPVARRRRTLELLLLERLLLLFAHAFDLRNNLQRERRRLRNELCGRPWRSAGPAQHADDLVANRLRVGAEVEQDARGDAPVLAHEAEQEVLGADVVVAEAQCLAQRKLQHFLRARRERHLARPRLVAHPDDAGDLAAHLFDRDVQRLEHARGEPFILA